MLFLQRYITQRITFIHLIAYWTFIMPCHVLWRILIIHLMHIVNTCLTKIVICLMRAWVKVTRILNKNLIVFLLVNCLLRLLLKFFLFKILIGCKLVVCGLWKIRPRWNIIRCYINLSNLWLIFHVLVVLFWTHLTLLVIAVCTYLMMILALLISAWYWRSI
jgi:hypothetical protein